jgi:hypothetical protein
MPVNRQFSSEEAQLFGVCICLEAKAAIILMICTDKALSSRETNSQTPWPPVINFPSLDLSLFLLGLYFYLLCI